MKKKAYIPPEQRIVTLQHQQDLLIGSVQSNGLTAGDELIFVGEPETGIDISDIIFR